MKVNIDASMIAKKIKKVADKYHYPYERVNFRSTTQKHKFCQDFQDWLDEEINHKGDEYGRDVTVSAPSEVWDRVKQSLSSVV